MTSQYNLEDKPPSDHQAGAKPEPQSPEWAGGLRQLYNSVVDEPLPDAFKDLLAKLDHPAPDDTSS